MSGAPESITCPTCRAVSYNPNDVRWRYCGACHKYHDDMAISPFATLLYSWDELNALAGLVDQALAPIEAGPSRPTAVAEVKRWSMLNSLRTSLREAQYGLRRPRPDD